MMRSSILVTGLTLIASLLGFLVQVLMAQRYGVGVEVDAYLYAISAPTFFAGMLALLCSYAIVPRMAKSGECTENQGALIVSLLALSAVVAFLILLISPFFRAIQSNLLPANSRIGSLSIFGYLLALAWISAAVQVILAVVSSIFTGLKKAKTAAVLNLGPYLGMLGLMLIIENGSVIVLIYGLMLGAFFSILVALTLLRNQISRYWRKASWEDVRFLVLQSHYGIVAMTCFAAYTVVDGYWAPRAGEGVLASLGYSQRIMIALGNLAVAGPSAILVPKFSELVEAVDATGFLRVLKKILLITLTIGSVLAVSMYFGIAYLIEIANVRVSFDLQVLNNIYGVLRYCLPGMVCMLVSVVGLRVLFCFDDIDKYAAIIGALWGLIYFTICGALLEFGGEGLAMAFSLTWFFYLCAIIFKLKKKFLELSIAAKSVNINSSSLA